METYGKGEIAKKILLLALAGGALVAVCMLPGMAILFKAFDANSSKERFRIKRSVAAMEKQGLVIRVIKNGKERLLVTGKGKEKTWSYLAEDMEIKPVKKWDKKWRILMFDIPETKSKIRREVSWKIKDIGMKSIQNSVFTSPFPCTKEIDKIAHHYNIKEFFIYAEADTIETNQDLIKYFGLK